MYYTDDSLLPENQDPLMITAAPYGPFFMPDDYPGQVPVTWDEQVQAAKDCYNAGASILHIHVRDPKTGHISKNFKEYGDQIGRSRRPCQRWSSRWVVRSHFAPARCRRREMGRLRHAPHADRNRSQARSGHDDSVLHVGGHDLYGAGGRSRGNTSRGSQGAVAIREYGDRRYPEFYIEHLKRLKHMGSSPTLRSPRFLNSSRWSVSFALEFTRAR